MKTPRLGSALLLPLLLVVAAPPPAPAADARPAAAAKTFAVIPYYAPEKMWQLFSPFVEYLRAETGEPWELKLYPTHAETIEAVCAGKVDVALLGPVPLGAVSSSCAAAPFLVPVAKDGRPVYHAMLLTADPEVASVAGLRGRKVGFFKGSTAAHVLPVKMLRDAGLPPGSYEEVFLESQDKLIGALLGGGISGAGVKEALFRRFAKEPLRVLATSEPLPNFSFCALPSQPPAFRERFVAALLELRPRESAADAALVKAWDDEIKNGFVRPPADFLPAALKLHELSRPKGHEAK